MIFLRIKRSHFVHFKQNSGKSGPKFSTNWHGLKTVLTSTRPLLDDGGTEGTEQRPTPKVPNQAREPGGAKRQSADPGLRFEEGCWRGCGASAPPQYEPMGSGGYAFRKIFNCHMGTAIKRPVPDRVKPFFICNF